MNLSRLCIVAAATTAGILSFAPKAYSQWGYVDTTYLGGDAASATTSAVTSGAGTIGPTDYSVSALCGVPPSGNSSSASISTTYVANFAWSGPGTPTAGPKAHGSGSYSGSATSSDTRYAGGTATSTVTYDLGTGANSSRTCGAATSPSSYAESPSGNVNIEDVYISTGIATHRFKIYAAASGSRMSSYNLTYSANATASYNITSIVP